MGPLGSYQITAEREESLESMDKDHQGNVSFACFMIQNLKFLLLAPLLGNSN